MFRIKITKFTKKKKKKSKSFVKKIDQFINNENN